MAGIVPNWFYNFGALPQTLITFLS